MRLSRRSFATSTALAVVGAATSARAQLVIDMTRATFEPKPIAVVDFAGGGQIGGDIAGVVRNDLQNSGLFRSIAPGAFIQKDVNPNGAPRFPDWRSIGAEGLVDRKSVV